MSNITVCARFRPLSSRERRDYGDSICIQRIDDETFSLKDEKEGDFKFTFDRVFYETSEQVDVYTFLARPIVRDAMKGINGTIITYGQTGAGKTYSMEGVNILDCDEQKKGLLSRVIDGFFEDISSSGESIKYTIKLSMVEIYMGKVRDLFDLSKDNIQIKESKSEGILLYGVTKIPLLDPAEALQKLSHGLDNRAVGETQMNMGSSRSHSLYIFTIQQEMNKDIRGKYGKLILVDLAGSEKLEKTGAEGRAFEEAKTINKSLSALGNVVCALTCGPTGRGNHIPYRDSKLTRILQDALGGNSRTALLCCCSPSPSNAAETLSTLRFGARAKHIKASPNIESNEDKHAKVLIAPSPTEDDSRDRTLDKVRVQLHAEEVNWLQELSIVQTTLSHPNPAEDSDSDSEGVMICTIVSARHAMEELATGVEQLKHSTKELRRTIEVAERLVAHENAVNAAQHVCFLEKMLNRLMRLVAWFGP
ncbi:kinesin-like protein KIN-1 isoform X2 [Punica granatum]|uniref:Kinesin-like protein n=1 Tax=Punica granatum TaxID=22663 RepID=A0A6P8CM12_PUNGR|nr:kinesin-like protein KIN-1 isoform X2 [Punica granatum]